jgi:hypothetical protein
VVCDPEEPRRLTATYENFSFSDNGSSLRWRAVSRALVWYSTTWVNRPGLRRVSGTAQIDLSRTHMIKPIDRPMRVRPVSSI